MDLLVFRRLEIIKNRIPKLFFCNLLFLIDKLFNCRQRICHIGNAHLKTGDKVINRTALFDGFSPSDAIIRQGRAKNVRNISLRCLVNGIFYNYAVAGHLPKRFVPCTHQVLIGLHVFEVSISLCKPLSACEIHAVVHHAQKQSGEVDVGHTRTAVAPFSGNCCFHAADGTVIISVLFFYTPPHKGWNDNFIIIQSRHTKAQLHDFDTLVKEMLVKVGMVADCQIGLCQPCLCYGLKNQETQLIHRILFVRRLAADGNVLVHGRACGA